MTVGGFSSAGLLDIFPLQFLLGWFLLRGPTALSAFGFSSARMLTKKPAATVLKAECSLPIILFAELQPKPHCSVNCSVYPAADMFGRW